MRGSDGIYTTQWSREKDKTFHIFPRASFWVKQKNKRGTKEKGKKACHACVLRKKSRQYLANRRRDRRRKPKSRPRDLSLGRLYRSACRRAAVAAAR